MIVNFFEKEKMPKLKVLYGLTGSGKTELLIDLNKCGYQIINLEKLSNHRGSVFGHIGLGDQPTQKHFENLLFFKLNKKSKYYIIEGESHKIGKIIIPNRFYEQIIKGKNYFIESSLKERIKRLKKYYIFSSLKEKKFINESLNYLKIRLGYNKIKIIKDLLIENKIDKAIEILLINYYDILYKNNNRKYIKKFCSNEYTKCLNEIKKELN